MYLISYTKFNTNMIAFIITLVIFVIINLGIESFAKDKIVIETTITKELEKIQVINREEETNKTQEEIKKMQEKNIWEIEIPKINLKAEIAEGTTEEVMNQFVGHFINTNMWNGNVGLAAHNRGYPVNYFSRIKELQNGDEIIYTTNFGKRKYEVCLTTIIKDTDWSYLEKTEENTITLITCVENEPKYRRCIQGIERRE